MAIQSNGDYPIDPATVDGDELAARLNRQYDALISSHSSTVRPDYLQAGGIWAKSVNGGTELYLYDGSTDALIVKRVNGNTNHGAANTWISVSTPTAAEIGDLWLNAGVLSVLTNTGWMETGILEAPNDGRQYIRTSENWEPVIIRGKNKIINGNFDVWQRGTSFTGSEYTADRWVVSVSGSTTTTSRQSFTLGQTDVPGEPEFFIRSAVTTGNAASDYCVIRQKIEGVRTLAGQTATVSFWAKADAAKSMAVEFDQSFGVGGSVNTYTFIDKVNLTTSWQKFDLTAFVPSVAGKTIGANNLLALHFWFESGSDYDIRTGSLGFQSGTFDIAQVQVEAGPAATNFETLSYGETLALCRRYYQTNSSLQGAMNYLNEHFITPGFGEDMRGVPSFSLRNPTGKIHNPGLGFFDIINFIGSITYFTITPGSMLGANLPAQLLHGAIAADAEL